MGACGLNGRARPGQPGGQLRGQGRVVPGAAQLGQVRGGPLVGADQLVDLGAGQLAPAPDQVIEAIPARPGARRRTRLRPPPGTIAAHPRAGPGAAIPGGDGSFALDQPPAPTQ